MEDTLRKMLLELWRASDALERIEGQLESEDWGRREIAFIAAQTLLVRQALEGMFHHVRIAIPDVSRTP